MSEFSIEVFDSFFTSGLLETTCCEVFLGDSAQNAGPAHPPIKHKHSDIYMRIPELSEIGRAHV